MDTLTLARYYCEMSLMDMALVPERGSLVASACLLMALLAKGLGGWVSAASCPPLTPSPASGCCPVSPVKTKRSSSPAPADSHPAVPLRISEVRFGAGRPEAPRRALGSPR